LNRPRVLLIAEAANPEWVSVPLVGWCHSQAIARRTGAHLVTQVRNKEAIERTGLREGEDFTAIDSEEVARWVWRLGNLLRGGSGKGWTTVQALSSLSYYYFEHLVWKRFGQRIREGSYDVVHRLTPLSPTVPSLLAAKCRAAAVPFVLGPLNGGIPWPRQFDRARRKEKEWLSYVRRAYKLLPGSRGTLANSSAIVVGSAATLAQVPRVYRKKCFYIPENAIDPERFTLRRRTTAQLPLRLLFVGRLVPYKGADMVIEGAAVGIRNGEIDLEIIGDGPQMNDLVALIARETLQGKVRLSGWVEHARLQERMADADVFVFPSIREFGGGAVLEAMAVGLVPIVMNYGGPGELVTEGTGYLISMSGRAEIVRQLREVLSHLVSHPEEVDRKSPAAMRRARKQFTWEAKAKQMVQVYDWVTKQRAERPQFAVPTPELGEEYVADTRSELSESLVQVVQ